MTKRDFTNEINKAVFLGLPDLDAFSNDYTAQKHVTVNSYKVNVDLVKGKDYTAKDLYSMATNQIHTTGLKPYAVNRFREAVARHSHLGYYRVTFSGVITVYNNFTMPIMCARTREGLNQKSIGIKQITSTLEHEDRGLVKYLATDNTATLFFSIPDGYAPI